MNKINVLVPIANGIEELEFVSIVDILRRASISVRVSTIEDREISGAHQIKIVAESDFIDEELADYDAIILPGGTKAAESFSEFTPLINSLKDFAQHNKLIAAICASPARVLARHGLLNKHQATCYPSLNAQLKHYLNQAVVIDGHIITSQGPGTAMAFAFSLVEYLSSSATLKQVKADLLAA